MKKFLSKEGFTLVELMVVVAIIGILSAVAIPNFKKYQAKSKTSEAKLQLASIYSAQTTFQSDFDTFASCLTYMGYVQAARGYYVIGHSAASAANANAAVAGATGCDATGFQFSPTTIIKVGNTNAVVGNITAAAVPAEGDTFLAKAVGHISADVAAAKHDIWQIDENKTLGHPTIGY